MPTLQRVAFSLLLLDLVFHEYLMTLRILPENEPSEQASK